MYDAAERYMIDFLKYRYICAATSIFFTVLTLGLYGYYVATRGHGFKLSIDFTGGTQIHEKFSQKVTADEVKAILHRQGWEGAAIRQLSDDELLVRIKEFTDDPQGEAERVRRSLEQAIPGTSIQTLQVDSVGPAAGGVLRAKSWYTVLVALLAMLVYIGIRFQFAFAVGAIIALVHDAIAIMLLFLALDWELSIQAIVGMITVLGYSVNDTIVIFSRIRTNIGKMGSSSMAHIANVSINQTLTRTLRTSFATALSVLALFLIGGESLRDFSLALLVGIVVGTYSSIYIASPVMLALYKRAR